MANILKGIFALPLAVVIVCAAIFAGTVILMGFTLFCRVDCGCRAVPSETCRSFIHNFRNALAPWRGRHRSAAISKQTVANKEANA